MIFTNKHGLPEEVASILSKQRYDGGDIPSDYSVTTLKTPPRIVQLTRRYKEEITEDVIDNLWSMFGHMAHNMLEEHGSDESITEKRLYLNILDRVISGQVDHYKDGVITDYKVTSAWTLVYGSRIKEWEEQLNMYAYLCIKNNLPVQRIRIITILRDWDKNKAFQNQDYPQTPIKIIPITLWEFEHQRRYIEERVHFQTVNENKTDEDLWECTSIDMWEQPSKYAVMKEGRKTAIRVFDTLEEANKEGYCQGWKEDVEGDVWKAPQYLQIRPGKRTRCEDGYCSVTKFCNQFQNYLKEKQSEYT